MNSSKDYFKLSIDNLTALISIPEDEIDDEDDITEPSSYAFNKSWELLHNIRQRFPEAYPYCSVSLEPRGGIDLIWDNPSRKRRIWVKISHQPKEIDYIFYREKENSNFSEGFSLSELCNLLTWLINESISRNI
jgi:hypothetical protein